MVQTGDDLCQIVQQALSANDMQLEDGDIVVLAQKIVSKAEGRAVALDTVVPSPRAAELAAQTGKDARLVELILSESDEVMRAVRNVIIVRHRLGLVLANAGIDQSNVQNGHALLLPLDPDGSAVALCQSLHDACGRTVAVLVIDSLGRAWRMGTTGTTIGSAGLPTVQDLRGKADLTGRLLESSELCVADEIAAAASLAMGQADEGTPIVIVRGLRFAASTQTARDIIRPRDMDMFP